VGREFLEEEMNLVGNLSSTILSKYVKFNLAGVKMLQFESVCSQKLGPYCIVQAELGYSNQPSNLQLKRRGKKSWRCKGQKGGGEGV